MRDIDKIQRQVHFIYAPAFQPLNTTGINNTWFYNRAPDGYVFELIGIDISPSHAANTFIGIFSIFDGHEYTHWNIWPGVESWELLGRLETDSYGRIGYINLHNWECKEYTIGVRSRSETEPYKACAILWYHLKKMSWHEKLYYAVIQPRFKRFKKTLGITAEPREMGII